jgi:hypothetical protein
MADQLTAAGFDGIIARLTRATDLSGNADSKSGVVCIDFQPGCWLDAVELTVLDNEGGHFRVYRDTSGKFHITAKNSAGTTILDINTDITLTWHMGRTIVLAQWDLAAGSAEINVNGIDCLASGGTLTDDTIDYTRAGWAIGSRQDGTTLFSGVIHALWFDPGRTYDFDTGGADISKFVDARNYWADTSGVTPLIYFLLENPEASHPANSGSGGTFTYQGSPFNQWWPEAFLDTTRNRYVHHDDTRRPFILNQEGGILLAENGTAVLQDTGKPS